jgi:hypothetical protein
LIAAAMVLAGPACAVLTDAPLPGPGQLEVGTWGGDGFAAIVGDSTIHVHFGCTLGDFPRPVSLDSTGRFSVVGQYVIRAYPVQLGPSLPARFSGVVRGRVLTLAVAVDDTVERKLVAFGPSAGTLGQPPRMGPCPVCSTPRRLRSP